MHNLVECLLSNGGTNTAKFSKGRDATYLGQGREEGGIRT